MKKLLKILGIFLVLLLGLLLIGFAVVRKMFPPEKIKEMMVQAASEKLKREIRLGEIKIGLFSGIQIQDFALSEAPAFKNGTFVQSEKFVLKFQLLPLLKKKILIDELSLSAPQIRVVQNPDGKSFNFSDLIASSTAPSKSTPQTESVPKPTAVSLTVSKLKITRGKVEFIDRSPKKIQLAASPIELAVTGTGLDAPMQLDLLVGIVSQVQGKKISGELKSKMMLDLKEEKVQMDSLQFRLAEANLVVKGKVNKFLRPELDLSLSISEINFQKLADWVTLTKDLRISGSPKLELLLKGTLEDMLGSLSAEFTESELAYQNLFQKEKGTGFSLSCKAKIKNQKDVSVDSLQLKLGTMELTSKGELTGLDSKLPGIKMEIQAARMDLKQLRAFSKMAAPYDLGGEISLRTNAVGTLNSPKINGSLSLDKVQAKVEKMNLDSLNGQADFTDSSLEISKLTGKISAAGKPPADFTIKTSVKNFSKPEIFLDAQISAFDLGMFEDDKKKEPKKEEQKAPKKEDVPYKGPEIKCSGKITVDKVLHPRLEAQSANASWNLSGITPDLNKLSGALQVGMGEGKMQKVPVLSFIAPILRTDPSMLAFSKLGGNFTITQGIAKTDDFQVNSPVVDLFAKGTLSLPKNLPEEMMLTAKLPAGSIGGSVGEFLTDEAGRPTFVFKMKGSWKPTLDTSLVTKKATEELKKKGTEILKEEGKKLLEGFFGR